MKGPEFFRAQSLPEKPFFRGSGVGKPLPTLRGPLLQRFLLCNELNAWAVIRSAAMRAPIVRDYGAIVHKWECRRISFRGHSGT